MRTEQERIVFLVTRNKNEADERRRHGWKRTRRFSRRSDTSTFKKRLYLGKKREGERERERERRKGEGASGGEEKERDSAEAKSVCSVRGAVQVLIP